MIRPDTTDKNSMANTHPSLPTESELEVIVRDVEALDRQGKLDDAAIADIEIRVVAELERQNQADMQRIAAIKAGHDSPLRLLPKSYRVTFGLGIGFLFIGMMLEITLGKGFIFIFANEYRAIGFWIFLISLPLVTAGLFWLDKNGVPINQKSITKWLFWPIIFPLMIGFGAAMIIAAPLGYLALGGWAFGTESEELGIITSVGVKSGSARSCHQFATLQIGQTAAKICLDKRLEGGTSLMPGDQVTINGRTSLLGTYVEQIQLR